MEYIVSILIILISYGILFGIILKLLKSNDELVDDQMELLRRSETREREIIKLRDYCEAKEDRIIELDRQVMELRRELEKKQNYYIDGKIIKAKREELGMAQQELADKLGISAGYLQSYEQGRRDYANYELTRKFKDVLGYFHTPVVKEG